MQKIANLIFPHQLFANSPLLDNGHEVYLIEEQLFFKAYRFHKQKIALHRASMRYYQQYLQKKGIPVIYVNTTHRLSDITQFAHEIATHQITTLVYIDPVDQRLEAKLKQFSSTCTLQVHPSPQFLNDSTSLAQFFHPEKRTFFQTTFYKQQRIKRTILLEDAQKPQGGEWTYDTENRKKYPRHKIPPSIPSLPLSTFWEEAVHYVHAHFQDNPGRLSHDRRYPITHQEAKHWLEIFLRQRFHDFGPYEDAIVRDHTVLHHSMLSPLLNIGLLVPQEVVEASLAWAQRQSTPINSVEGFIRQIIGWREFIRGMYLCKGEYARTRNFWGFSRKLPISFYEGNTGIMPIDHTIQRVLETGYCHHIERLMVLGNFMLLCEFDPDEVYRWFMELFIDAYDWVMVPNVYGMSQFADGGTFATKPYIGGANYLKKMSNYAEGDWATTWDGLFWRFVGQQQAFFQANPRTSMLYHTYRHMPEEKRSRHLKKAEAFLESLYT